MSAHRFSTGQSFYWNGNIYEVKRLLPEGQINLKEFATGAIQIVAVQQLVEALFAGDLKFLIETRSGKRNASDQPLPEEVQIDLSDYPEHLVEKARFRLHVIKPLLLLNPSERTRKVINQRIRAVKAEIAVAPKKQKFLRGLSRRSIFRWLSNYTTSGHNLRALIDNTAQCGGKGKSRLEPEVKNLLESVIKDHYYRAEAVSIDDIMYLAAARMAEENQFRPPGEQLIMPDRSTIARRIEALDMRDRFEAKRGKQAAKHKFDQVEQMDYPKLPLERVEIDQTTIDVIVVDEEDNLPLGRPTLTYSLDCAWRYPLGYYVGFEPASYYTVMECLYHSICPKPNMRDLYGTEHDWIAHGIPSTLVVDNAREFIGRDLEDACQLLGTTLIYAPVRTPEFKAAVERKFKTLNSGLFHTLPGTTFGNIFERGDYDSVKQAVISLSELEQVLNIFVVDIYAERFHTGLNGVPARRWEQAIASGFFPRLPADKDELLILLGRVDYRTIQRYGIDFLRLRYNHPELSRLRHLLKGEQAKIKYHPGDLSRLYVHDPFNQKRKGYIEVPALDQEYTRGLSLWKHQVILSLARREADNVDMAALGRAKLNIQSIVEAARTRKRTRTRARIARWDRGGQPPSLSRQPPEVKSPAAKTVPEADGDLLLPGEILELSEYEADHDEWELVYVQPKRIPPQAGGA